MIIIVLSTLVANDMMKVDSFSLNPSDLIVSN